jgi:hypothetical protein
MSFLSRVLLVVAAGLCLKGAHLVMQRHLSIARAGPAPAKTALRGAAFSSIAAGYRPSSYSRRYVCSVGAGVGPVVLPFGTHSLLHRSGTASSQLPRTSWHAEPSPASSGRLTSGTSLFVTRRF